jgi:hypothetical protein
VEIVSGGTNFEPQNVPEYQEVTLAMLRSSGGEAYRKTTTEVVLDRRVV